MGRLAAIRAMHDPKDWAEQREARRRIAFEELFFMQAGVLLLRKKREEGRESIKCAPSGELVKRVREQFPFRLTEGSSRPFAISRTIWKAHPDEPPGAGGCRGAARPLSRHSRSPRS